MFCSTNTQHTQTYPICHHLKQIKTANPASNNPECLELLVVDDFLFVCKLKCFNSHKSQQD